MTYLSKILEAHRAEALDDNRPLDQLIEKAQSCGPTRGFADSLRRTEGVAVISEIKRRSPSKGELNADLDPAEWAQSYAAGGASCLSVLTDRPTGAWLALQLSPRSPVRYANRTSARTDPTRLGGTGCVIGWVCQGANVHFLHRCLKPELA
mgnify:CR=1 FL=1